MTSKKAQESRKTQENLGQIWKENKKSLEKTGNPRKILTAEKQEAEDRDASPNSIYTTPDQPALLAATCNCTGNSKLGMRKFVILEFGNVEFWDCFV